METSYKHYQERDNYFNLGLGLIVFCFLIYCFRDNFFDKENDYFLHAFINYAATLFYLVVVAISNLDRTHSMFRATNRYQYSCLLTLATISCFTLNLQVNIFDNFSAWVNAYVLIMYVGLLAVAFMDKLPNYCRIPIFSILGAGTALSAYFTIYLLPLMPFGLILFFFLGITLHLIVPLLVFINFINVFRRLEKTHHERIAYFTGLAVPIVFVLLFMSQWQRTSNIIKDAYWSNQQANYAALPDWVAISQQLSDGFFTQRILKGEIVYTTFSSSAWGAWGAIPQTSLQEKKEHDPLVAIATAIYGTLPLKKIDRLNILKFYGSKRHDTHRKLWSGSDLITTKINNKIEAYPAYRLAYIEKTFVIKNNHHRWRAQQEALYTFQLPQGAVATSLSLWVDGQEEQSRLTTRGKADSAYVSIVRVERRDPALLHWQEGNQLTVTVFPCTNAEDRIFKIGITAPMQVTENDELCLPTITFDGPSYDNAEIQNSVEFPANPLLEPKAVFSSNGDLICPKPPLKTKHFTFKNKTFWMEEYQTELEHFDPEHIYLDINKSWSWTEFEQLFDLYLGKNFYVYEGRKIQPIYKHSEALFERLQQNNFSLFPIQQIDLPKKSLIISKSSKKSPNLSDIKETQFGENLIQYLSSRKAPIAFFSLSNQLSPYLKTLKEFHVFKPASGSFETLTKYAQQKKFPALHPSKNAVVLEQSNLVLYGQENNTHFESKAPDHLMRLFAYHQILKKIGKGYFKSGYENQELIDIATEAHVVSPISTLIVLETKKDYDRFDIEENEDGLGNASDKNKAIKNAANNGSGAVPEPHEWFFILLSILGLIALQFNKLKT